MGTLRRRAVNNQNFSDVLNRCGFERLADFLKKRVARVAVGFASVVALLLAAVGVMATAPSLWLIGAAIAIWTVVPLARIAHEFRSR